MKKLKLITTVLSTGLCAASAPLMLLTSCAKDKYSEVSLVIKEDVVKYFKEIVENTHFATWDEGEVYNYIKNEMTKLAPEGVEKVDCDHWSVLPEVLKVRSQNGYWHKDADGNDVLFDGTKRVWNTPKQDYDITIVQNLDNAYGNIWYDLPATKGYEDVPTVIYQAHMDTDMAFPDNKEQAEQAIKDWEEHCIQLDTSGESEFGILESKDNKTSLGADNAIGVAELLAIAKHHKSFPHGTIRLLFSADENDSPENFQAGIHFLKASQEGEDSPFWTKYKTDHAAEFEAYSISNPDKLLSSSKPFFDSKNRPITNIVSFGGLEQKKIYTSSAGIHQCTLHNGNLITGEAGKQDPNTPVWTNLDTKTTTTTGNTAYYYQYEFNVNGLEAGHAALNVNDNLASAIQLLSTVLQSQETKLVINNISTTPNNSATQISTHASAVVSFPKQLKDPMHHTTDEYYTDEEVDQIIKDNANYWENQFKIMYPKEKNLAITATCIDGVETPKPRITYGLNPTASNSLLDLMYHVPYGPVTWFDTGAVETSLNLGPIYFGLNEGKYVFGLQTVARSANDVVMSYCKSRIHRSIYNLAQTLVTSPTDPEKLISHTDTDIWEKQRNNPLLDLTDKAFKFFLYKSSHIDRHSWVSVASLIKIFTESEELGKKAPNLVEYGAQIYEPHSVTETLDLDSINSVLRVALYIADHFREIVE